MWSLKRRVLQSAVDLSTDLVAEHGRIILVGYHQSNNGIRAVNMQQWNYKAIDVINGHVRRADEKLDAMRQGMMMMAQGYIETEPMVQVFPLDDTQKAFEALDQRQEGLLKAVLMVKPK